MYEPRTYLTSSYMGTLGFAYPTALGAKVGRPDSAGGRRSTGDGGFLFCATELATAAQYGINVVTVVFDDGAYGNSNRDQRSASAGARSARSCATPTSWPSPSRSGPSACGSRSRTTPLRGAIVDGLADDRPVVIEMPMERLPSLF